MYIIDSSFASKPPHALNQRSPARSGIENRWPKGKAKVKGRSPYKQQRPEGQEAHSSTP